MFQVLLTEADRLLCHSLVRLDAKPHREKVKPETLETDSKLLHLSSHVSRLTGN